MSENSFKYLSSYLAEAFTGSGHLPDAVSHTRHLQQAWDAAAPAALRTHAQPVLYRHGILTLAAKSSAWATTLRHQQHSLTRHLNDHPHFAELTGVRVRVEPPAAPVTIAAKPAAPALSAQTGRLLEAAADDIDDPHLRDVLRKLARRAGP